MSPDEQRDALRELARAEAQLAALRLRVLAEAERSGAGGERGAPSAADWVAIETRQTRIGARSDLKLANALEDYPVLVGRDGCRAVNTAQARAIVTALDRLPTTGEFAVSTEQRAAGRGSTWSGLAAHHDAKALAVLGRRFFEVIAPDLAEAFEGKVLADQEANAARRVMFTMREDDAGTCHGRFRIPTLHGQWLRKMLLALCSPVRSTPTDIDETLPTEVRHGHAFCQLIEAVPANSLPKAGGCGATIVVTMRLDQLLADLHAAGVCDLDTGGQITAAQARRLACTAGIIPAVLGGRSEVLDLGRSRRGYTAPNASPWASATKAAPPKTATDHPPCATPTTTNPGPRAAAPTSTTGRLLCGHHHRRIHDPTYTHEHLPNGKVTFHRRT